MLTLWSGQPMPCRAQGHPNWVELRNQLVEQSIIKAGIKNPRVIEAIRKTPRHEFVPMNHRKQAYEDMALPIGEAQTISPPYIVAFMTEQLDPQPTDKVLEIGTGSGYQAAVLSEVVREVYSIEIVAPLGQRAAKTLKQLGYTNVFTKIGDGYKGWPEHAPFDKIIVTCSPEQVPVPLATQLKEGGRMVIPVGERYRQTMYLLTKKKGRLIPESLHPTFFVPMTGQAEAKRHIQPDPLHPAIHNGDFEETLGNPPMPGSWYYQRQMELVTGGDAPSKKNYVKFHNSQPGRESQAIQGFAVDGRKVKQLEVSMYVRGDELHLGENMSQWPRALIVFFDENRAPVGEQVVKTWRGTFSWQHETARVPVPQRAREAILVIGLLGAQGELSFDLVELKAVGAKDR